MPNVVEMVELPIYDTEDLKRMGQRTILFAIPVGGFSPSPWRESRMKDFWETNMLQAAQLPAPNRFVVRDLQVLLYDKDGPLPVFDRTGIGSLWAKSNLRFSVGCKLYWQGPLSLVADPVCQMGGLQTMIQMGSKECADAFDLLNYQRRHDLSVLIQVQQMFTVEITPYTPVCRQISARVVLNGQEMRSIL